MSAASLSAMLAALRTALVPPCDYVAERVGEDLPAARRHKGARIVSVEADALGSDTRHRGTYAPATRTIEIQAYYAATKNETEANAADFFESIRAAVVGKPTLASWGSVYAATWAGEPVALGRDGGYYTYTLRVTAQRAVTLE